VLVGDETRDHVLSQPSPEEETMIASALPLLDDVEWDGHMDMDGGWWIVMVIGMVLFWGLVILGIVWIVRALTQPRRTGAEPDAMGVLERRFAAGEISADEYHERRAVLRGETPPPPGP
jgi:putative membrane protein